jgi:hypothetical protein
MLLLSAIHAEASAAEGQDPGSRRPGTRDPSRQRAANLYSIGTAARAAGNLAAARLALTAAYRTQPTADGLRELGLLALAENRPLEARELLQRYLRQAASDRAARDPAASAARAAIQKLLDAPPPPHGRLRILGEPGALVWLDEHLVGVLPLAAPLLLSPDEHRLRLEQRGGSIESPVHVPGLRMAEARLSPGDSKTLVVELLAAVLLVLDDGKEGLAPSQSAPAEFTERLSEALENAHLTLLPTSAAVEFTGAARLGSCLSQATCQAELARLCAVDYALHLRRVRAEEPMRSPLELRLMDAAVGEVAASAVQSCEDCEAPALIRQLTAAVSTLVAQASARPRGQLEVLSSPVDAEVRLNGRLLGHTPYRGTLWVGTHSLVVQRSGWRPEERRLQVLAGLCHSSAKSVMYGGCSQARRENLS